MAAASVATAWVQVDAGAQPSGTEDALRFRADAAAANVSVASARPGFGFDTLHRPTPWPDGTPATFYADWDGGWQRVGDLAGTLTEGERQVPIGALAAPIVVAAQPGSTVHLLAFDRPLTAAERAVLAGPPAWSLELLSQVNAATRRLVARPVGWTGLVDPRLDPDVVSFVAGSAWSMTWQVDNLGLAGRLAPYPGLGSCAQQLTVWDAAGVVAAGGAASTADGRIVVTRAAAGRETIAVPQAAAGVLPAGEYRAELALTDPATGTAHVAPFRIRLVAA